MKTLERVEEEIVAAVAVGGPDSVQQILWEYAESIVDACAGSFECTMEDDIDYIGNHFRKTGQHPVLVRESVLAVKKQIV